MISRIAPTLLFVLATMVSAKELAVVQKDFQRTVRPVLQKFCFDCHGENKPKAGIRVDYLDGTVPDKEVRHWEIIRKQLLEEEMPPEDDAQPSKAERAALVAWIDGALQMARTRARPKNGGARRLRQIRQKHPSLLLLDHRLSTVWLDLVRLSELVFVHSFVQLRLPGSVFTYLIHRLTDISTLSDIISVVISVRSSSEIIGFKKKSSSPTIR